MLQLFKMHLILSIARRHGHRKWEKNTKRCERGNTTYKYVHILLNAASASTLLLQYILVQCTLDSLAPSIIAINFKLQVVIQFVLYYFLEVTLCFRAKSFQMCFSSQFWSDL